MCNNTNWFSETHLHCPAYHTFFRTPTIVTVLAGSYKTLHLFDHYVRVTATIVKVFILKEKQEHDKSYEIQ